MKRIILIALGLTTVLSATTIHVPADFSTIGGALAVAEEGDTVAIANGVYSSSTNGEGFPLISRGMIPPVPQ